MKPAARGVVSRASRRAPTVVTLGYLVVVLPLLWRGPWSTQRAVVAVLHVVAMVGLSWSLRADIARARADVATSRANVAGSFVADWLPLLLVPFLYEELPYLMAGGTYHDALVRGWESWIFGTQPARTLAGALPNVLLSELLHLGYLLYYPIVYVPPLLLYVAGRREEFARTVLAVMLTYVVCYVVFVLFPVEGPRYAWGAQPSVPAGPIRWLALEILERGSSRGTAFPSSHAAVAVSQAVVALRYQPGLGIVVALTSVLLMIGAVYGGFHYAIDVLVGAIIGMLISGMLISIAVATPPVQR